MKNAKKCNFKAFVPKPGQTYWNIHLTSENYYKKHVKCIEKWTFNFIF